MDFEQFQKNIQEAMPEGTKLQNPGGGITTITSYLDGKIAYIRGSSTIYVTFQDLFDAYSQYKGNKVNSNDLKSYSPSVFDSSATPSGHSCNCTFLFVILNRLGLVENIEGGGVRGSPFFVVIAE